MLVAVAPSLLYAGRVAGWTDESEGVPSEYLGGLRRAGVIPVVLGDPGVPAADVVGTWAGVVLCGGPDVAPATYGQTPHPAVYGVDERRDRWEMDLVLAAGCAGVPVLAICRGIQILNVALGGTLVQHLPDVDDRVAHGVPVGDGVPASHPVDIVAGSRLAASQGGAAGVASCVSIHHQAIADVADGLVVTARSPDGLVEAVETPADAGWCLAVQWHPERSAARDPAQQAVFDAFGLAAEERRGAVASAGERPGP